MTTTATKLLKVICSAPQKTGVYFFLDKRGKTLYVGKAINIKNRLRSHFANTETTNPAKIKLLKETRDLTWELCDSEPEALIREAELVKKLKPKYNVLLRDDKNYFYVGITKEPFPKVFLTHQPANHGIWNMEHETSKDGKTKNASSFKPQASSFIGPFTDGNSLKRTLKLLRRIFPYCTCTMLHTRECLAATLGRCMSVCCLQAPPALSFPRRRESRSQTNVHVQTWIPASAGMTKKNWISRIRTSKKLYRKNIKSLEEILRGKKQRLADLLKKEMQETAKEHRFEDAARLRDQIRSLEEVFSHCTVVANGEFFEERKNALRILQKLLKRSHMPHRIEMYDLSNIQGNFAVGSLVVFTDGIPDKSRYRRFKIKTVDGIDDIAMMKEVIARRLKHIAQKSPITSMHKSQTKKEWSLPDVLIVDGGKGQMGAAAAAVEGAKLQMENLPILGLAKGKDELYIMEHETWSLKHGMQMQQKKKKNVSSFKFQASRVLPRSRLPRPLRHLLTHLQAEAHRFAITYYRTLHRKALTY